MQSTIHTLSPHVIIFATILCGALLSPFHRWGNKLTRAVRLAQAQRTGSFKPSLVQQESLGSAPHASRIPARRLPETFQPTLLTGPAHGLQAIPLSPFHSLLGLVCSLGPQSLGSMPSIASLPCGPAPGSWPRRPGWSCHGNALPLDCLVGPTSHWNVSEIPPSGPASKPPLPDSHSQHRQRENLFRSCPDLQLGKQMATMVRPP